MEWDLEQEIDNMIDNRQRGGYVEIPEGADVEDIVNLLEIAIGRLAKNR